MRKFLLLTLALIGLTISSANAQTVESSHFLDNWSLGLKGGAITPMKDAAFWGDMRGVVGIELQKNITPVWGLGIEGQWTINTSNWQRFPHSTTAFDHQMLGVYSTVNLMNLFAGYNGKPRTFEINIEAGVGWLHAYMNNHKELYDFLGAASFNSWYTKFGPDFNFNLGKDKAWTIGIKPAFVYNMNYPNSTGYDIRHGYFEILAGVTYHLKNKNGTHSFALHSDDDYLYDIACLQDENKHLQDEKEYLQNENKRLVEYIEDLENKPEKVVEVKKEIPVVQPEVLLNNVIGFKIDNADVSPESMASLENIANWLKENPDVKIEVIGHASANTGSEAYNDVLSLRRANAVRDVLVTRFNINPDRLIAKGQGINPQLFAEPTWNQAVTFKVAK